MGNELSKTESKRLEQLIVIVKEGEKTFVKVGQALTEIRESKLYRAEFDTFEAFCQETFGFSRVRAHQLIEAAEVVSDVSGKSKVLTIVNTPQNEGQARELAKAPPEKRKEAWQAAVDDAPKATDGTPKVTAAAVRKAVEQTTRLAPEPKQYRDELGAIVTSKKVIAALDRRGMFKEYALSLSQLKKDLITEANGPAGGFLDAGRLEEVFTDLRREVVGNSPHCQCTECKGDGKVAGKKCDLCRGHGYLSKHQHSTFVKKDQEAAA